MTQQLARVSSELLAQCSHDLRIFESVLGGETLDEFDYLDLDWAPSLLEKASIESGTPHVLREALRLSTNGILEVMPGYSGVYSNYATPTCLVAEEVDRISVSLRQIDVDVLLAPKVVAVFTADNGIQDPRPYGQEHLAALRAFYAGAAERQLAVMMWWD